MKHFNVHKLKINNEKQEIQFLDKKKKNQQYNITSMLMPYEDVYALRSFAQPFNLDPVDLKTFNVF